MPEPAADKAVSVVRTLRKHDSVMFLLKNTHIHAQSQKKQQPTGCCRMFVGPETQPCIRVDILLVSNYAHFSLTFTSQREHP